MLSTRFRNIVDLAKFLYIQRWRGFDVPDEPFLDEGASARLHQEIERASFYLEFGSGGSTILAARRGVEAIAVDSDRFFLRAVGRKLPKEHRVTLVHGDIGLTRAWGWPVRGRQTPKRLKLWRNYVDIAFAIVRARNRFPDFIFVDGRFRVGCALESARQAQEQNATATIMVDDYESRSGYHSLEKHLGTPERAGRAALFRISPGSHPAVSQETVANAMRDPF